MALLREPAGSAAEKGLEVLLMTRPATSSFAAGAEVFPGGSVDAADLEPGWARLDDGPNLNQQVERHLLVTAVRETFEECAVLLARDAGGNPCPPHLLAGLAPLRRRTQGRNQDGFLAGLQGAGLRPGWEDLAFCAHWVTPQGLPRIFDTRFFLAALPAGQEPIQDDPGELESMRWVRPGMALREAARGQTLLLPPTRAVLEQLADQPSVAAALRAARGSRVQRVQPKLDEITSSRYPGLDIRAVLGQDPRSER
ncbi:MAG: NUDIX hydrolase [Candidatus Dormiibacterota bacterium]